MNNNKVTLLLLTCGTNACYHVSKRLKECFGNRIRIVGADINKEWMIPTKPFLDGFYQCPFTSDPSYYPFILSICKKERVNFLMPSFDADQKLFYDGNVDLEELAVKSFGISQSLIDIYQSKENTNSYLNSVGLPIPKLFSKDEVIVDKEYFCKPRNGVGSIGVKKMRGADILNLGDTDMLIEEVCSEPEVTLECFNFDGKVYSVARERLDTKSGVCTKARVYHDASLEKIAQIFAGSIKLPYIFNLQFMTNTNGEKVITDVNLRTAGGMSLSYAAGWDEAEALGKIMLGEKGVVDSVSQPIRSQYVIRAYTDIVTKTVEKRIAFDLDGTLLDSRKRHQVVMDYVLNEMHLDIDTSNLVSYKADGHNNVSWLESKGVDREKATSINKRWVELIEEERFLSEDVLYGNTIDILKKCSQNNYLLLLTARNNVDGARKQISKLGLFQYFDDIKIVETSKKTPNLKGKILKEEIIDEFYGDTESDMVAAEIAGCKFLVSTRGFRSPDYWKTFNVCYSELFNIDK